MRCFWVSVLLGALCFGGLCLPSGAHTDCEGNLLVNPGFEEGGYKTEGLGTSLSSSLGNGWSPWSVLGGATYNREVEYKVLDAPTLPSRYHIHGGNASQKFFTTWGTHTAGFYQRVKVVPGSRVSVSIWAQIYTGERELTSGGQLISDLDWPTKPGQKRGPGQYKVFVGLDPYGDAPPGFGAPPSPNTVWSAPVTDFETRTIDASGRQIDAWVKLSVSAIAQRDHVTVYTRGQPEYPVKHNDSFWDDACLTMERPPTATARPTQPPTNTPTATYTPGATDSAPLTETAQPAATPVPPTLTPTSIPPTGTAEPSLTARPATATPEPATATKLPTAKPTQTSAPPTSTRETVTQPTTPPTNPPSTNPGLFLIYGGGALLAIVLILWLRFR